MLGEQIFIVFVRSYNTCFDVIAFIKNRKAEVNVVKNSKVS